MGDWRRGRGGTFEQPGAVHFGESRTDATRVFLLERACRTFLVDVAIKLILSASRSSRLRLQVDVEKRRRHRTLAAYICRLAGIEDLGMGSNDTSCDQLIPRRGRIDTRSGYLQTW